MKLTEPRTILVTFLMQLGDLILITPFLTALRRAAPQASITLLMDTRWYPIMEANPDIDQIITIDRRGKDKNWLALWQRAKELRQQSWDLLINLNPSERCTFLAAFSGAHYRTGVTPGIFSPFFHRRLKLNRNLHAADMYLDTLRQLDNDSIDQDGLKIVPTPAHQKEAADFFAAQGISTADQLIGFNIGSASATKRWPPERFAQVADALTEKGYKIVFLGSAAERDMVDLAVKHMHTPPIIATGAFSTGGLVAVIQSLRLLITNDSGPMHIGVSQKTPLVALFGPSKPALYGPYHADHATIITAIPPCQGCQDRMKHSCPDMRCMYDLQVDQVLHAALKQLENKGEI